MARVVLVVSDEEKELWVKQAHQELITLSEWLRRAARQRAAPSERPVLVEVSAEELEQIRFVPHPPDLALEEAAEATAPTDDGTSHPASEPSASSASCRRVKIHHIYSAEKPCPLCGYGLPAATP